MEIFFLVFTYLDPDPDPYGHDGIQDLIRKRMKNHMQIRNTGSIGENKTVNKSDIPLLILKVIFCLFIYFVFTGPK